MSSSWCLCLVEKVFQRMIQVLNLWTESFCAEILVVSRWDNWRREWRVTDTDWDDGTEEEAGLRMVMMMRRHNCWSWNMRMMDCAVKMLIVDHGLELIWTRLSYSRQVYQDPASVLVMKYLDQQTASSALSPTSWAVWTPGTRILDTATDCRDSWSPSRADLGMRWMRGCIWIYVNLKLDSSPT